MHIADIPFSTTDWSTVERVEHQGETGLAHWRTQQFGAIRARLVEYSAGYVGAHWCSKGHILFCLDGDLNVELKDGRKFSILPGSSYQVADNAEAHRSSSDNGAMLFIVD